MSEFVYLYRGGSREGSPEQMQQVMQKWIAWMKQLGEKGHMKDQGHPLERAGKLVKGSQKTVTDGPFAETREQLGGYALIDAKDMDEAIRMADGFLGTKSPAVIEIRPVAEVKGLPTH